MSALRSPVGRLLHSTVLKYGTRLSSSTVPKDARPVLYSYCHSSCSWRVRIALGLKKVPYEIKATSLLKTDETHCYTNEYRELNPMQQVPALRIDGQTLCDSVAIMHYLEETRPEHPLLPIDPIKRAKVREIVEIICSGIQPLQNRLVLAHLGKEKSMEWAQHWISRGFRGLEQVLSASSGKYCVGDEISMADCCLVPQVFNARRYKVDLEPYPTILRIDQTLGNNAVFLDCHPNNQPDYAENKD
ncbi:probable maleylacetoacetate isomerase 2 isoform X2 [Drosophila innubila]|uniref:probable maleylacetoacetate isomerase 2 isoform X2 n=1 Tax=Drosophila innubila TaxID=198719 RepID=UPI00148CB26C|nr:probable maleylacetoacetate isomerase 2 isoform X2 [Drosophila innubila]